jgi:hypothetical protein
MNCFILLITPGNPARSLICSFMRLPRINHFLSRQCHWKGWIAFGWSAFCIAVGTAAMAAESDMKIYLLIMLIGSLLAAIHFTSAPKRQSETLPR